MSAVQEHKREFLLEVRATALLVALAPLENPHQGSARDKAAKDLWWMYHTTAKQEGWRASMLGVCERVTREGWG